MSNIIDTIQVSGVTYTIAGGGSGNSVVEVTQAQYDAMVSGGTVDPTILYIITDAQAGDLTQYWTSAQTQSAITEATSGKVDSSSVVSSVTSASTDSEIPTAKAVWDVASQGGGGGGGSTYSAGTNIDITNDIISCTLPIREGSNSSGKGIIVGDSECTANGLYGISLGHSSDADGNYSFCNGSNSYARGQMSFAYGNGCDAGHDLTFMLGYSNKSTKDLQFSYGRNVKPKNYLEFGFGTYNNSSSASTTFGHSGNTMFSIGNGYDFSSTHNWHNAFEVRQNGDIYIANTNDTSVTGDKAYSLYPMIKLQDHLGGGSITVDDTLSSTSTNPVQNKVVKSATDRICKLFGYGTSGQTDILAWATGATSSVVDDYVQFSKINGKKIIGSRLSPTDNFSLVETSAITSSITSSSTDAQVPSAKAVYDAIPTTTSAVTSGSTAVVESGAVYSQLGGLKLVKLTQTEYDNLSTKDSNTLYVIVN